MSLQVLGRDQLVHNLAKVQGELLDALVVAVEISQAGVSNFAKANHPYVDRTGQLTNSIQPGAVVVAKDNITGEIIADKAYASWVELGTSRSRPFPFLYPALAQEAQKFSNRVRNAFTRKGL